MARATYSFFLRKYKEYSGVFGINYSPYNPYSPLVQKAIFRPSMRKLTYYHYTDKFNHRHMNMKQEVDYTRIYMGDVTSNVPMLLAVMVADFV